jgi:hypothetical protein
MRQGKERVSGRGVSMAAAARSLGDAVGLFVATFNNLAFFLLNRLVGDQARIFLIERFAAIMLNKSNMRFYD